MDALNVLRGEEIFTHEQHGVKTSYNTTALLRDTLKGKVKAMAAWVPITLRTYEYIKANNGIEQTQLDRIDAKRLQEPILMAHFPEDDTYLVIDGSHRLVKTFELGHSKIRALIYEPEDYKSYIVTGFGLTRTLEEAARIIEL